MIGDLAIYYFEGAFRFLSNFHIEPDGTSVEVEFQRRKCIRPEDAARFDGLTPVEAKKLGRRIRRRPDWNDIRVDVMRELVRNKFTDHPALKEKLLATGEKDLVEGNWWGDAFWGVCKGRGENQLGKILVAVREELRTRDPLAVPAVDQQAQSRPVIEPLAEEQAMHQRAAEENAA